MKKTQMILNTDAETLSQWLENHTRQISTRYLPTDQGLFTLQRARQRLPSPGRVVLELDGIYVNETRSDGTAIAALRAPAITFTLLPLSKDRLEVRAECNQPIVYPVFDELLGDFALRWPEAGTSPTSPEPDESDPPLEVDVPDRSANRRKWVVVWDLIRDKVYDGDSPKELNTWLLTTSRAQKLPTSADTLRLIIRAGKAGTLD